MKIKAYFFVVFMAFSMTAFSQTLYVPSGTSGIGSSLSSNVGIGTNSPSNSQGYNKVLDVRGTSSKILVTTTNETYKVGLFAHTSLFGGGGFIGTESNHNLGLLTNYTQRMLIKSNGNIGINCDPGDVPFKIYNSNLAWMELAGANSRLSIIVSPEYFQIGNHNQVQRGDVLLRNIGASHNIIMGIPDDLNNGNSYIGFSDDAHGVWMRIQNNKEVRIDGKIFASEINVRTNVWADNVFSPRYNLKSLNEVESFIKMNQRLPDLPSEQEVKDNGINLAEMNTLLLKKIEETMLYIIELKKQNEELRNRIEQIENK